MACKDGFCQEEGDGDSDAPRFYSDPLLLLLFGDLVSPTVSLSVVLEPSRSSPQNKTAVLLLSSSPFSFWH